MLDISERKRAEEHQRLLTGELQHRVGPARPGQDVVRAAERDQARGESLAGRIEIRGVAEGLAGARPRARHPDPVELDRGADRGSRGGGSGGPSRRCHGAHPREDHVRQKRGASSSCTTCQRSSTHPTSLARAPYLVALFAAEVGGEVKLTYAPTGLVCRLEAPLASMQEPRDEVAA
jgi:hypothetical protein